MRGAEQQLDRVAFDIDIVAVDLVVAFDQGERRVGRHLVDRLERLLADLGDEMPLVGDPPPDARELPIELLGAAGHEVPRVRSR